ncbi:hypothetical protein [Micromonospora thermarum]|uniref:Uncharacterized protein n=1 Tax=Micromonospora thermarum TaxID=2720024 RepID=A0ABX0ZIG6_9ACTN|nr:hypothetical protein [Micromonospora thermarum]NJP35796.1 hypothetical protein [Micromonospora thermarum]
MITLGRRLVASSLPLSPTPANGSRWGCGPASAFANQQVYDPDVVDKTLDTVVGLG